MDAQAILLHAQIPAHLLSFLSSYVFQFGDSQMLYSTCFDPQGMHVGLDLFPTDKDKERMKVRIPLQFVLATAQLSQEEKNRIGFV